MEVRPGYKQTEVGVIPADWPVVSIASVARLESGHTPSKKKPSYWNGSVPWVSLHDTSKLDSLEIHFTSHTITEDGLNNSSARLLPAGTVVFSRTATVGKCCVMARAMATSQDFACYVCGPSLNNYFLVYLFRGMDREWRNLMAGSIHNTIYMPVFKALKIPLPSIEEQRTIASALSDMDALLDGLDRLITKKRAIKQATMQQLLTGQSRLPGFSGEWEVKQLGDIAWIEMGQSPDSRHYNRSGNGLPLIQGNADIEARRTVARVWTTQVTKEGVAGDLLLTVRAPVGAVGKISEDCCLGRGVCSIRPKVDADFLFHTLVHLESAWKNLEQGSTFTSANSKQVASFTLLVPVDSQEQISIATILSDMDTEITALETRRTKTRAIKQAMMQELLTGRTRLV